MRSLTLVRLKIEDATLQGATKSHPGKIIIESALKSGYDSSPFLRRVTMSLFSCSQTTAFQKWNRYLLSVIDHLTPPPPKKKGGGQQELVLQHWASYVTTHITIYQNQQLHYPHPKENVEGDTPEIKHTPPQKKKYIYIYYNYNYI